MAVTEKRQLDETVYSTKHIVLDIEGTTTSISFVKDTLFPYVRKNLDGYLNSHWNEEEFKDVLALLKNQATEDKRAEMEGAIEIPSDGSDDDVKTAVAKSILWQMDADRKTTALKKLQGQMWRKGYKTGELKGHLFADVAPSLKEWVKDGRKLYVYSSGSVEAQKLLFGNSVAGDLTELFTDFFDTGVGAKVDMESYKSIVKKLECNADDVLFLTDLPKEASAAREAGLPVILVEREGNEPITNELRKEFSAVSSFQELAFESTNKKPKVDSESPVEKVDDKTSDENEMEVDSAEKPEETVAKVEAEPMDVVKEESVVQAETAAEEKKEEKIDEKDTIKVDLKEETEVKSDETEAEETKPETEVKDVSDLPVKEAGTSENVEIEEKSTEEVKKDDVPESDVEKEVETEKTDVVVPQEKTEEQDTEKVETESQNAQPKEDIKTEDSESMLENVKEVEESLIEKKDEKVEVVAETKDETDKDVDTKEEEAKKVSVKEIPEDQKEDDETETKEIAIKVSKETNETEDTKSVKDEEKTISDEEKSETKTIEPEKKENSEEKEKVNGTSNGTTNGTPNGTSNGTANGAKGTDTNGTVENGHSKVEKEGIPEVIVAKNTTQIEKGTADSAVVVEA